MSENQEKYDPLTDDTLFDWNAASCDYTDTKAGQTIAGEHRDGNVTAPLQTVSGRSRTNYGDRANGDEQDGSAATAMTSTVVSTSTSTESPPHSEPGWKMETYPKLSAFTKRILGEWPTLRDTVQLLKY
uniref:Uncharacterized protein n=1 Tax=Kwoniella bestiolae CBS 10118 TaxID=1296100 RepID=A0A1B9G1D3_9TREE|nr:hypothetical protein I302_06286 [Kwoniella bestiolae CBS 10118]OCF24825.1 hypothetical protein I302_06286 [Kwoniella bestiolae CBS 10118]